MFRKHEEMEGKLSEKVVKGMSVIRLLEVVRVRNVSMEMKKGLTS